MKSELEELRGRKVVVVMSYTFYVLVHSIVRLLLGKAKTIFISQFVRPYCM